MVLPTEEEDVFYSIDWLLFASIVIVISCIIKKVKMCHIISKIWENPGYNGCMNNYLYPVQVSYKY